MPIATLLKALVPSFLPLIIFVLADSIFGETIGLLVGLGVGLIELLVSTIRERRLDPFLLVDTLLLALAGALSLALRDEIFIKLKPALVELVFGLGLALLLVLPGNALLDYFRRQLRGIELPEAALPGLRRNVVILLGILGLHAGLTVWAALSLSTAAWGFVSGGLLYILFAVFLLVEWLKARRARKAFRRAAGGRGREELLPLVDEEGRIVGAAPRSECHRGPGKLHPVVRLYIVDGEGGFYLQKRSASREVEPGKWDCAAAGHVGYGEELEAALLRELREELGVNALALEASGAKPAPLFRYRAEGRESELVFGYGLRYTGDFAPDRVEVETGRWWRPEEIEASLGKELFTPALEREWLALKEIARRERPA